MTDTTNLALLAKLDIRDALNHKLIMAYYFVPKAVVPPQKEKNMYLNQKSKNEQQGRLRRFGWTEILG
jgi:hypothetical protein